MKCILYVLLLFIGYSSYGQPISELIPREDFFREKEKTNISLSLDGESVLYTKTGPGAENRIFYVQNNFPAVEKSKDFDGEVIDFLPVPDEGVVAVVSIDSVLKLQYTTLGTKNIRTIRTIPFRQIKFLQSSDRFPNKIAAQVTAENPLHNGIYLFDLLGSREKRIGKMDDFSQLFFDQNYTRVAGLKTNADGGNSIFRFHEGEWKEVFSYPFHPEMFLGGFSQIISVSKDGKTIYATDNLNKDKASLVAIDRMSGKVEELASDPDADLLPYAASVNSDGVPTSVVALWGDTRRHFLDETVEKDFKAIGAQLDKNFGYVAASADDQTWLIRTMDGGPMVYYIYHRKEGRLVKLFNDYPFLDGYDLPTRKAYTVMTRDSLQLPVHVYVPAGMARADGTPRIPLPTIVYVHGGPWAGVTHWNSWFHTRNFQLLANRGYAVINMEFRGTTGLGKELCDAGDLQWGTAMHNDIVDVTKWAVGSGIANEKRLGIWGWSYGGYATNYALAAAPELFTCGVSMYGISDLYAFSQLPFTDNDLWRKRVGNPNSEEGAALLKEQSPRSRIDHIRRPLLLTTGSLDERVPQSQSDDFADALAAAGKEVVYFYYPEEVHDYRRPESWISFWAVAEDFLQEHVGGRKEPKKEDIEKGNFIIVHGAGYIETIE